jgi:TonB family protein
MRLRQVLLILLLLSYSSLHAQTTEADLKSRLTNKPLYLRGCWRDDKLHFDSTGHLRGTSGQVTFTLSGFDLKKVQLKQDKLILEGRRVGLELSANKQTRVALRVGDPRDPQEDESIHIEIDASPNGNYGPALDAIFVEGLADLVPSLPYYWKRYAERNFLPSAAAATPPPGPIASATASAPQSSTPQDTKPQRIGGKVTAPRVLHQVEPTFNESARALKYNGTVLINLLVGTDGTPSHLSVIHAIGLGLDESALATVQQYVFQPAMQDGKPVVVELNIEVNFQIF